MTRLHRLFDEQGKARGWNNLTHPNLKNGTLAHLLARGFAE